MKHSKFQYGLPLDLGELFEIIENMVCKHDISQMMSACTNIFNQSDSFEKEYNFIKNKFNCKHNIINCSAINGSISRL